MVRRFDGLGSSVLPPYIQVNDNLALTPQWYHAGLLLVKERRHQRRASAAIHDWQTPPEKEQEESEREKNLDP
jgi:hypothetical protein